MYKRPNTVVNYVKTGVPHTVVRFLSYGEKWAVPIISANATFRCYYGTMSPDELSDRLKQLTSIHGDKFEGFVMEMDKCYTISFQELLDALESLQDSFKSVKLP